ncbi:MAG: hypothetical protein A2785_01790 [Candidatus Chisholmbacteria bacterium RIFCSPHIGHO2_01_FULL_49_18]|uniref:Glycosyl transferase family 28 C-terminal domain-containing protein n=2 Tax=Candidatus Chisholmiibacteriota TaxID=1817900 RepID=A0A1G1VMQ8_9BACT|nr:MAG: hypothetical protein A2785_01790 [Candidatus Chisholmbacteria bacterium RIFCSPHIGHO2_01_FULL_49_18]OGY21329.1 MAG: hypothetical protein A3A65_05175 [Candidatus Chisholmbacteria bacterium RIFCSPLOWO2_01_FULL_49_14]
MDEELKTILDKERKLLEEAEVPIATVSATFFDQIEEQHAYQFKREEIVFSRAHYSQALSLLIAAGEAKKSFWFVDPTNFVAAEDWQKVLVTEKIAEAVARHETLKKLKDIIDTRARDKLPISDAIKDPLLYLFENVKRPIASFHYETGNLLAEAGKTVLQAVTDPHVRPQYLKNADKETLHYAVFDDKTKIELLEGAQREGKKLNPDRVVVTGPPVDPRIVEARKNKSPASLGDRLARNEPLKLAITTGGLGTNKGEIETILVQLLPFIKGKGHPIKLICYAGTHEDFATMFGLFAQDNDIHVGNEVDPEANYRILRGSGIMDANEKLVNWMFPWADGVITKPSGDMAYDSAAAGCFLLLMEPWGEWEERIQETFEQRGVARRATPETFESQLKALVEPAIHEHETWFTHAVEQALKLDPIFLTGAKNILDTLLSLGK